MKANKKGRVGLDPCRAAPVSDSREKSLTTDDAGTMQLPTSHHKSPIRLGGDVGVTVGWKRGGRQALKRDLASTMRDARDDDAGIASRELCCPAVEASRLFSLTRTRWQAVDHVTPVSIRTGMP